MGESSTRHVASPTLATRLWSKVDRNGPLILDTPCWVFTGYICKDTGYGKISNRPGVPIGTHVAAYLLEHGEIPLGKFVLHRCDHRPCVRHIYAGTPAQNVRDMVERQRTNNVRPDRKCPVGHEYDDVDSEGFRRCSACRGLQSRRLQIGLRARLGKQPKWPSCDGCAFARPRCRCTELLLGPFTPILKQEPLSA